MKWSLSKRHELRRWITRLSPPFHFRHWRWWRLGILLGVDFCVVAVTYWISYLLRFEWSVPADYVAYFRQTVPLVLAVNLPIFWLCGMYRELWRHANYHTALNVGKATLLGTICAYLICSLLSAPYLAPKSVFVIHWMVCSIVLAASRFSWRSWIALQISVRNQAQEHCFIYGAGSGGDLLARHIVANERFPYRVVGFIDDDRNKQGRRIHQYTVLGTGKDLSELCKEYGATTVILAMPSAGGKQIRAAVAHCHEAGARPWIMPDMTDSLGQEVFQPRAVDTRDLLRRSPKSLDFAKIRSVYSDRVVAITGAGGSIGSEICRQVIACRPKKLILIDSSEFNLYKIDSELEDGAFQATPRVAILGSTINRTLIRNVFETHRPDVVLHAAADKHVPIVEANVCEGVRNNVLGTLVTVEEAVAAGASRFVLISTDKAVRPTSVMGASKRICELILQAMHERSHRRLSLCSVRFGNVLGSSGSVIPRFLQQIQKGGPVTVTHRDMNRYFMLTSEAVGLVLQASALSRGGEIFVLNMGEPVRIFEMAEQLIRLAGKEPGRDIEIEVTGIRPGEKLYEELLLDGSEQHTIHDDVFIATPKAIEPDTTLSDITRLIALADQEKESEVRGLLKSLLASELALENDRKRKAISEPEASL